MVDPAARRLRRAPGRSRQPRSRLFRLFSPRGAWHRLLLLACIAFGAVGTPPAIGAVGTPPAHAAHAAVGAVGTPPHPPGPSRGSILDRNGIPLATGDRALLETHRDALRALGVDPAAHCPPDPDRCYPLGGLTYHLLGDVLDRRRWTTPDRFVEQAYDRYLERPRRALEPPGGRDPGPAIAMPAPRIGPSWRNPTLSAAVGAPGLPVPFGPADSPDRGPAVDAAAPGERDLRLSIDARLQVQVAELLQLTLERHGLERGAVVVIDPATGDILAAVSHPHPPVGGPPPATLRRGAPELRDRARFSRYPPGSTFKLVTSMAALRVDPALEAATFRCEALGGGRVGFEIPGRRVVKDDELDHEPHGDVDLEKGIRVSCNAYFAQLAVVGVTAGPLLRTAALFGIQAASPDVPEELDRTLEQSAFGQGEVLASPLRMALVAGTVANHGVLVPPRLVLGPVGGAPAGAATGESPGMPGRGSTGLAGAAAGAAAGESPGMPGRGSTGLAGTPDMALEPPAGPVAVISPAQADRLATAMRRVVTSGTAEQALSRPGIPPIAGKTGTAEVAGQPSHAWFIGFAPYRAPEEAANAVPPDRDAASRDPRRVAVAVLVENAGYGGRFAAPLAGRIVLAAQSLGLIP